MKTENRGKTVLITGVSKGIGKSLTKKMLADNYFVIGTSRDGNLKEFEGENFYPLALSSRISEYKSCVNKPKKGLPAYCANLIV